MSRTLWHSGQKYTPSTFADEIDFFVINRIVTADDFSSFTLPSDMWRIVPFLLVSVGLSSLVFPATLTSDQLELTGFMEFHSGQHPLQISLSLLGFSQISLSGDTSSLPDRFSLSNPDRDSGFFNFSDSSCVDMGSTWPSSRMIMSVGPTSEFMQQARSISLIRHASNESLVSVGIRLDNFDFMTQSCRPRTAFLIPFEEEEYPCFEFTIRIRGSENHALSDEVYETCYTRRMFAEPLSQWEFMTVPEWISRSLIRRIRNWGANPQDAHFTECDRSVLSHLPDLEVSFLSSSITVGTIILFPKDYLIVDEVAGTCRLRIVNPAGYRLHIDVLRLPFINVRLTQSGMTLCDPI